MADAGGSKVGIHEHDCVATNIDMISAFAG